MADIASMWEIFVLVFDIYSASCVVDVVDVEECVVCVVYVICVVS